MGQIYEIEIPPKTYTGPGCLECILDDIREREIKKCLIVTDSFLADAEAGKKVRQILESADVSYRIYKGICPNPTIRTVAEGVEMCLEEKIDALISLGGGSAHDCAKAMRLTLTGKQKKRTDDLILIAVNTTAGTGSEATKFAIITDEERHQKMTLTDSRILPDIAVNDAILMTGMPKRLTAYTGMDALTHAIESYVSVGANAFTKGNAAHAIRLITQYLPKAYEDGSNLEARDKMAYAQYMAGIAFSNSGLGMVHAMAHQLGGMYDLPHGFCNAVLLPYVAEYNMDSCKKEYAEIMDMICPGNIGSDKVKAKKLVRYLKTLNRNLDIPERIAGNQAKEGDEKLLAEMAKRDPSLSYNPKQPDEKKIESIYRKIMN